jgi:flagellar biosynthesis/type III secretory pathway chaperone
MGRDVQRIAEVEQVLMHKLALRLAKENLVQEASAKLPSEDRQAFKKLWQEVLPISSRWLLRIARET